MGICDKLKAELSSLTRSMATKLRNLLVYGEVKEPKAEKTKFFFFQKMYDYQNLQDADIW